MEIARSYITLTTALQILSGFFFEADSTWKVICWMAVLFLLRKNLESRRFSSQGFWISTTHGFLHVVIPRKLGYIGLNDAPRVLLRDVDRAFNYFTQNAAKFE